MPSPRVTHTRLLGAIVGLVAFAFAAAPAGATHFEWTNHTAAVGAGPDADLADVATTPGGVAVAVGGLEGGGAVIQRRPSAGGAWVPDSVANAPAGAQLTDVAVSAGAGWAIGTYPVADVREPLVVRLDGAAKLAGSSTTWEIVAVPDGMEEPRSIALQGPAAGLIGDAGGDVFEVAVPVTGNPMSPNEGWTGTPKSKAVNGIALFPGGGGGYAVADHPREAPEDPAPRIYSVHPSPEPALSAAPTASSPGDSDPSASVPTPPDFAGVAALSGASAIAIERNPPGTAPHVWQVGAGNSWAVSPEEFDPSSSLRDISMGTFDGATGAAIAGDIGGEGAVWRRSDAQWVTDTGRSSKPLNGVSVGESEMLAVGDDGVVQRYAAGPHSPAQPGGGNGGGGGDGGGGTGGGSESGGGSGSSGVTVVTTPASPPEEPTREAPPPPPPPPGCERPDLRGENVVDIQVDNRRAKGKRRGGQLIVRFKLRRPAKVRAVAIRDGKVVGKTKRRKMDAGKNQVRVSYRKAPETVRINSKLLKKCPEGGTK